MTSFNDFGLAEPILRALAEEKYVTPTPIQNDSLPLVISGRDLIGIAQTGTGKTAAFALPILNRLATTPRPLEKKSCRVLVLAPTRELSGQISDSFRTYARHMRVSVGLAIGGVPMGRQVRSMMNGVDILVATPGRLLDLVRGNAVRLGSIEMLVLDEADRMLDMGFINDIRKIVAKVPAERQTLLFSATMPREIADLADSLLRDPARVAVTPVAKTADKVAQRVIHTTKSQKPDLLVATLNSEVKDRAIVFTRTKHGADKVVKFLEKAGISSDALHGNKSQGQRERALSNFRDGRSKILVATDLAARGIDVDGVSHVINFDIPNEPESYVHRIGRTARAGAEGIAISFCDGEEASYLRSIERLIKMTIPAEGEPPAHSHGARKPQQRGGHRQRFGGGERREHRGDGEGRPQREARPHGEGRPQRDARPHGEGRPQRDARPNGEGRPQRDARPNGEGRPQRDARPHGEGRPQRDARPQGEGRPQRDARPHGEGRPQRDGQRNNEHRAGENRGGENRGGERQWQPRQGETPRYGEAAGERRDRPNHSNRPHHSAAEGERSKGERSHGAPGKNGGRPHRGQRPQNGNRPDHSRKGDQQNAGGQRGTVARDGEIGSVAFLKRDDKPYRQRPRGARPANA
ncbi:ATP-dependent RNA helicase RhlE [Variibacter gotjawalensis]|uniref:DEAD-box ATP-dependent RNA helicase RhpA n=1 Tax=Variibacter gotjawalensis TaxID=1333996 RepID=A0A0S3PR19_9BRAD|nr:DEAD/DEAH box helicase [Variibacter gotjawalensis]NIK48660.1 ATP-dependent RNA helicase RhlE [Variibacter gotjawalensis]RZS50521.1 ATP-dependent RNA helicase RhlE [Variibacter gotjawalensis]BAT58356.1 ATP-dependent RNA helicase RhlE [Variibacter gotjawalensis]